MENKSVPQSFGSVANRAYEIISIVAYLIGVQKVHFERDHEPPLQSVYDRLKQHPSARVMRSLCEIRSTMLKEYQRIDRLMQYELKNLDTLPDLFPAETLCALEENGIRLIKPNYRINRYIVDVKSAHLTGAVKQLPRTCSRFGLSGTTLKTYSSCPMVQN